MFWIDLSPICHFINPSLYNEAWQTFNYMGLDWDLILPGLLGKPTDSSRSSRSSRSVTMIPSAGGK